LPTVSRMLAYLRPMALLPDGWLAPVALDGI
jgi:hypothetical protein